MITTVLQQRPPPGKNPRSWGSPFWIVLHVSFHDQIWDNIDVRRVHSIMPHVLPCFTCRKNHRRFRREVEQITFRTPDQWVNEAHNFVNKMHGRPIYRYEQSVEITTKLYMQPWVWINSFFKMAAFLIAHYQDTLETPLLLYSFTQLLYFHPSVKKKLEQLCIQDKCLWKEDASSKMSLLRRLHEIHLHYSTIIIVPLFSDYVRWITEASYGDIRLSDR